MRPLARSARRQARARPDRFLHDRGTQSCPDAGRRVRSGALPYRPRGRRDHQRGRRPQGRASVAAGAAHAGARAQRARDRQDVRARRLASRRQPHRDRGGRRFPTERRKGAMRFNETAGSMARDSVFNAASAILRALTGIDPRRQRPARERRGRRHHRRTVGRPGDLPRALLGAYADAAAAGRRDHGRTLHRR